MELQYDDFDVIKREIRLLVFYPASFDEEIRCKLYMASLDDQPRFEALSYVWGDTAIKKPVIVNDAKVGVMVNLEAALRRLRDLSTMRTLWVDAICINQSNLEEKNIQVPLMASLYSTAIFVVAWLGEATTQIEHAVQWLDTHARKTNSSSAIEHSTAESSAPESSIAGSPTSESSLEPLTPESPILETLMTDDSIWETASALFIHSRVLDGFCQLYSSPCWTRMWTLQEFLLPRHEPQCVVGPLALRFNDLDNSTSKMRELVITMDQMKRKIAETPEETEVGSLRQATLDYFSNVLESLSRERGSIGSNVIKTAEGQRSASKGDMYLTELLLDSSHR